MYQKDQISVCICTFKRHELLKRLLSKMEGQRTDGLFDLSIVIVDNDRSESARQVVKSHVEQSKTTITYHVEQEQNIALARNRAVANAKGDFLAFIDDDEFPGERWLLSLYSALNQYRCDGVLGPVMPHFEEKPPKWVLKGRFFDRPTHPTGHVLDWSNTRTGNALVKRDLFREGQKWFDPLFGSGGEDRDFFRRKIEDGCVFVWCNEAKVFETVPRKRWETRVLIKRAFIRGRMALNAPGSKAMSVLKSGVAVATYSFCLPVFLFLGHHLFVKVLIKNCDHLGKVLAFLGIGLIKEKYV